MIFCQQWYHDLQGYLRTTLMDSKKTSSRCSSVRMNEELVSRRKVLFFYIFSPELKNAAKIWVRGFAADQRECEGRMGWGVEAGEECGEGQKLPGPAGFYKTFSFSY